MSEEYLRTRNRSLTTYGSIVESLVSADMRGLVNELGFRLYVKALEMRRRVRELSKEVVDSCLAETIHYVQALREGTAPVEAFHHADLIKEATRLAENIGDFFRYASFHTHFKMGTIHVSPLFKGCGLLDECVGDFLSASVLIEVKAGDRNFRSIDIRQVLTYCALNFASKSYNVVHVCLLNPRLGVFLGSPLERLCQETSGKTANEVLGEIVQFVSDPVDRYLTG